VDVKFHCSTENYIDFLADRNKLVCWMIDSLRHYLEIIYQSGLVMWPTKLGQKNLTCPLDKGSKNRFHMYWFVWNVWITCN
jgi:hypothetical protein